MRPSTAILTIISARCLPIRLDFRMGVTHSLASRQYTVNVCVECCSEIGVYGFGESVPRSYVTGETIESALETLRELFPSIIGRSFISPQEVISFLEQMGLSDIGCRNPAAMCALELSVLDLAGKHWGVSVSELLGLVRRENQLTYSLVVPLLSESGLKRFLKLAKSYRFQHVKVKVDASDPAARVRMVRKILGPEVEIRVDANCSWNRTDAPVFFKELARLGVVSVEQPLPVNDLEGIAHLRTTNWIPVTLDESVKSPTDVERVARAGACDIINVRISKCGGMLGALRVIEAARTHGLDIQLGAQVGESCILSLAGAHLASKVHDFRWLEGLFGTHLLVEDLCEVDIRFGYGGCFVIPSGHGFGINIDRERIEKSHARYKQLSDSKSLDF